jgi:hypothetical protein
MDKQEQNSKTEVFIPDFIPVYPKLPNEVYKKIDLRFIKKLVENNTDSPLAIGAKKG